MVFVYHVSHSGLPTFDCFERGTAAYVLQSGKFGVELFFGISGIVILPSLLRATSLRVFMLDRYARILPVLWATALSILAFTFFSGRDIPSPLVIVANLLALPPFIDVPLVNPAAWSLAYEFLFYACCAVVFAAHRINGRLPWLLVGVFTLLLIWYPRAILMVGGVAIARNSFDAGITRKFSDYPTVFFLLFLVLWSVMEVRSVSGVDYVGFLTPEYLPITGWLVTLPFIVLTGYLGTVALLGIVRGIGILPKILLMAPMQKCGTISFSFYLWPPLVMAFIKMAMYRTGFVDILGSASQLFLFSTALPLSLFISFLSWKLLEIGVTKKLRGWVEGGLTPHRLAAISQRKTGRSSEAS